MRLKLGILGLLLTFCLGCSGTNLFIIDKQDFYEVREGSCLGNDRHGYFLSDMYLKDVGEAKIRRHK